MRGFFQVEELEVKIVVISVDVGWDRWSEGEFEDGRVDESMVMVDSRSRDSTLNTLLLAHHSGTIWNLRYGSLLCL